ncbi:MAG: hypothetical protein IH933_00485 [Euryarchaeota archaeon]|jgi:acetyl-CoA C-acetyltransferase|nr:hypothetical protein [Euryarchaeota archaeon]
MAAYDTDEVVLVDGARTPHGTLLGSLADVSAVDLARVALDGLVERIEIGGETVEWVCLGNTGREAV